MAYRLGIVAAAFAILYGAMLLLIAFMWGAVSFATWELASLPPAMIFRLLAYASFVVALLIATTAQSEGD